jgi:quinol monooxygenase YgiN
MLIVAGVMEVDPSQVDEFIASKIELLHGNRAEAGCLDFAFSADPIIPGRVLLYERWEDKASLAAHLAASRARGPAAGPQVPVLSADIKQYDIAEIGAVGS